MGKDWSLDIDVNLGVETVTEEQAKQKWCPMVRFIPSDEHFKRPTAQNRPSTHAAPPAASTPPQSQSGRG